jgi:Spy/CpxP family protein refolding chaperone
MKNVIFILTLVFLTLSSSIMAQSNKEEIDMDQALFGMEKKAAVAEFIQLDGSKSDIFWNIYDEYETKRKDLGRRRMSLLNSYVDSYDSLDDASTGRILKEMINLQTSNDKLMNTYAKKIEKKVDVKTAAQFYQIEGYVLSKIRTAIMENIPVIGEWSDN